MIELEMEALATRYWVICRLKYEDTTNDGYVSNIVYKAYQTQLYLQLDFSRKRRVANARKTTGCATLQLLTSI